MAKNFDRAAENIGNIVSLEHVNTLIPDQQINTVFFVEGMGLTRDPYMFPSTNNMWINVGRCQFHMPTGNPQVLRGTVGLVMPDIEKLAKRLESVRDKLSGTKFDFARGHDGKAPCIEVTSPWGNRIRCYDPDTDRFGAINLGMPYVEFDVPVGTAPGIARFYEEIFRTRSGVGDHNKAPAAHVSVGIKQSLVFRETDAPQPDFDEHHIQVYLADFSGPYQALLERDLVTREDSAYQYRFVDIVDLDTNEVLFEIEHEVRSMTHPLYARPLVNRNPDQQLMNYAMGQDDLYWTQPRAQ